MFHVEHYRASWESEVCSTWNKSGGFLDAHGSVSGVPNKILLFTVPGIGACAQRQPGTCAVSSASWAPNQRMTHPSEDNVLRDHDKRSFILPRARDVTNASSLGRILETSNPMGRMATSLSPSFLVTSFRKAHFFLFGSSNVTLKFGLWSLIARPGKPAPEPTSASRPFANVSKDNAKMLSPNWNRTTSSSLEIVVRAIFRPHIDSKSMYDCILSQISKGTSRQYGCKRSWILVADSVN